MKDQLRDKILEPLAAGADDGEGQLRRAEADSMVDLIMKMVAVDPNDRPNIRECLQQWNALVLPRSFSRVFFQLSSSFVRP